MVALRDQIINALAARFAAVAGWAVRRRGDVDTTNHPKLAILDYSSEESTVEVHPYYSGTLAVVVLVFAPVEEAAGINPYEHLSASLTELQQVVHSDPENLGVPSVLLVEQLGHDVQDATEDNTLHATWRMRVRYRHDWRDPETYGLPT